MYSGVLSLSFRCVSSYWDESNCNKLDQSSELTYCNKDRSSFVVLCHFTQHLQCDNDDIPKVLHHVA